MFSTGLTGGRGGVASALVLIALTPHRASALSPPSSSPAPQGKSPLVIAASLAAGPYLARSKARYDPSDFEGGEPDGPSFDEQSGVAPGGTLTLTLGGQVGLRLLVGGALTIGASSMPNRFTGEEQRVRLVSVGPELALLPGAGGGAFAYARAGIGVLDALAWSAAVGGGYAFRVGESRSLGLGLQLSGHYSRHGEDGDHGTYTYKDELLAPALVARFGFD